MHNRLKGLNGKDVLRILKFFGFQIDRQTGSHQQWKKADNPRSPRVTVDGIAKSIDPGTLRSIIRQSGFTEDQWVEALDKI